MQNAFITKELCETNHRNTIDQIKVMEARITSELFEIKTNLAVLKVKSAVFWSLIGGMLSIFLEKAIR